MRRDYANLRKSPQPFVNLCRYRSPPRNRWAFFVTPIAFQSGMWRVLFSFQVLRICLKKFFWKSGLIFRAFFAVVGCEGKHLTSSLKIEYTFIRSFLSGGETLSRMEVCHDPPARKGKCGKQGRRAILYTFWKVCICRLNVCVFVL